MAKSGRHGLKVDSPYMSWTTLDTGSVGEITKTTHTVLVAADKWMLTVRVSRQHMNSRPPEMKV